MRGHARSLNPLARGFLTSPDGNSPLGHGCARVRTSNTRPATRLLTPPLDRTAEHNSRTSGRTSTASCTGRSRERGFRLAEVGECRRSHIRLHPLGHCPGFASPSCPVPMRRVSSRPGRAAGGTRFPGSTLDMTETAERHDPGGAIQSLRRRQQRNGLAAGRLVLATVPGPRNGSWPRSFRWRSATVAHGRSCSMARSHRPCRRRPSASP